MYRRSLWIPTVFLWAACSSPSSDGSGSDSGHVASTQDSGTAGSDGGPTDLGGPPSDGGTQDQGGPDGGETDTGPTDMGSPPNPHIWSRRFGDENFEQAVVMASAPNDSRFVLSGRFSGQISFGDATLISPGGSRAFLASLASDGTPEWAREMGDVFLWDLVVDGSGRTVVAMQLFSTTDFGGPDGVIPCCRQQVIGRFDDGGTPDLLLDYDNFISSGGLRPSHVALGSDESIHTVGVLDRALLIDGISLGATDGEDIWLAKYSSDGSIEWATTIAGEENAVPTDIAVGTDGQVFIVGHFEGTITTGGTTVTTGMSEALFVARVSSEGIPEAVVAFDTSIDGDVTVVRDGDGIIVTGGFEGSGLDLGGGPLPFGGDTDIFLARFGADLSLDWARTFGSGRDQVPTAVGRDSAGDLWLAGFAGAGNDGEIDFGTGVLPVQGFDIFLARFDGTSMAPTYASVFGGPGDQRGRGLGFPTEGGVVLLADGDTEVDFGGGPLTSLGMADIFVTSLEP
ncbi:MAG: hypothetical protein AAGD10_21170 [Myxococcota bacterium]